MVLAAETPRRVIGRMHEAYSSLRSYSDTGVVLTYMIENEHPNETIFHTALVRPNLFRFEWTTEHPFPPLRHMKNHSVIWSNAAGSFFWSDQAGRGGKTEQRPSLDLAVAGAAGVSGGSAYTIASLLWPEEMGRAIDGDVQWDEQVLEEAFEGTMCHHLAGNHPKFGRYEIWIGKDDAFVRKLAFSIAGTQREEIRRDIRANTEIPERTFASEK